MDPLVFNNLLNEVLLAELGDGLDSVADRLIPIYDSWKLAGGDPAPADVLGTVLVDLGWWRGRIAEALDPPEGHH